MASIASRLFGWWNESPDVHHPSKKSLEIVPAPIRMGSTPMELLSIALNNNAAIDIIERLTALQQQTLAREAEFQFNEALARVQSKIKRVAPDLQNPQTSSRYASYAALDRILRPLYTDEGFSLSFTHDDCPKPDAIRVICLVSKGSHTRRYQVDMPCDGKGAKGGDVMTKTHATAAADSYAKRYLVKDIFNVAIGEEDTDGNAVTNGEIAKHLEAIAKAKTMDELRDLWATAYKAAGTSKLAQLAVIQAKDARKAELR